MSDDIYILDKVQAENIVDIENRETLDKNLVTFASKWVIWENYLEVPDENSKDKNRKENNYENLIKKICVFEDLITFWQFWNNYPGSDITNIFYDGSRIALFFDTKLRIEGLNLFKLGIDPKWEDKQNKGGKVIQISFDIYKDLQSFLSEIGNYWMKLMLWVCGGSLPCAHLVSYIFIQINGVRFVDKSKAKMKILYRFEIWIHNSYHNDYNMQNHHLDKLKTFLKSELGDITMEDKPINP